MAMAHGFPAIQEALDHGLRPSLSSDHSATVAQDMFGIMRAAFDLQRLTILQRVRRGEQNLPALPDAARRAGIRHHRRRALRPDRCQMRHARPGKDADIVVLRADSLDVGRTTMRTARSRA
jgi:cytosine/adenosine deaminase-related metal-dependent hydrolase